MIRWGILGAGNIAHRFAKALDMMEDACLVAVSGRNAGRLSAFAEEFSVENIFTSHEELLNFSELDAVYIALPHNLHAQWAIRAMESHKAVMVEKPATMNAAEMFEISTVARNNQVLFMEAQKARFTPLYLELKKRIETEQYGKLLHVETCLCNMVPSHWLQACGTYHYEPEVGGALLDVGTYCANVLEDFCTGNPIVVQQESLYQCGVDVYTKAELKFESVTAVLETAFDRQKSHTARFVLEKAEILADEFHRPTKMTIKDEHGEKIIELPYDHDDFYTQIRHFTDLLKSRVTNSPIMSVEGSIRIAQILDLLRDNAQKVGTILPIQNTKGNDLTSEEIMQQEQELTLSTFSHSDAFGIGQEILNQIIKQDLSPVRIRIQYNKENIFQYLMDGKTGEQWLDLKADMVAKTGHSTWYVAKMAAEQDGEYRQLVRKRELLPIGGGFPLVVNGELCGAIIVSGLTDSEDHCLVVEALREYLNRK